MTALQCIDVHANERKQAILTAPDQLKIDGETYYVSCEGEDGNDGKPPCNRVENAPKGL